MVGLLNFQQVSCLVIAERRNVPLRIFERSQQSAQIAFHLDGLAGWEDDSIQMSALPYLKRYSLAVRPDQRMGPAYLVAFDPRHGVGRFVNFRQAACRVIDEAITEFSCRAVERL
jgi:hypothetical protein